MKPSAHEPTDTYDIDSLLALWEREERRRQHRRRLWLWLACGGVITTLIARGVFMLGYTRKWWPREIWIEISLISLQSGFGMLAFAALFVSRMQQQAASALIHVTDKRAIGPLFESLTLSSAKSHRPIANALSTLLPQLRSDETDLLSSHQRSCLHTALNYVNYNGLTKHEVTNFKIAILKALEQIGDSKAIPAVKKLTVLSGDNTDNSHLRKAALACLPYLQQRAAQQRIGSDLLRASEGATANLLLPVEAGNQIEPQVLLRSSTNDGQISD